MRWNAKAEKIETGEPGAPSRAPKKLGLYTGGPGDPPPLRAGGGRPPAAGGGGRTPPPRGAGGGAACKTAVEHPRRPRAAFTG